MTERFLPYAKQSLSADDAAAVSKALRGERITRGPLVEEWERAVSRLCGAQEAVAFSSGTEALKAAAWAAETGPFDRFFTTPNTFIATALGPLQRGAKPLLIDLDKETGSMDLELLAEAINRPSTRGKELILPVHFAGIALDMKSLERKITSPDTIVIEDGAHAFGSLYPSGERVGSCAYSHMTVFSFHPAKMITTGEGGMVTTNSPHFAKRLRCYRNNGIEKGNSAAPWFYRVEALTGNFHLTEFQAALGLSQLKRLDAFIRKRREIVSWYRELLEKREGIALFPSVHDERSAYHLFVIRIDFQQTGSSREELMRALNKEGIGTEVHYIPLYRHPVLAEGRGDQSASFPEMEGYYEQALTLPLYPDLSREQVERICASLSRAMEGASV